MKINDALDIMNSDYKLWQAAEDTDLGGGRVEKAITLPWGIGEYKVTLEGMKDAGKRRDAVGQYGQHIRDLIDERINDEAITSRAKAASARAEQADSEDSDGLDRAVDVRTGTGAEEVQEAADEGPEEAHGSDAEDTADLREVLLARRAKVDGRIEELTREFDLACRDRRGLDAALAAMDVDDEE